MANILIQSPFEFFTDRAGRPLSGGRIYIGLPNQDPENFPLAAFFDLAGNVAATQPIRTNTAGYPSDPSGAAQRIFTSGAYSIRIKDSNGVQVFYSPNSSEGFYGVSASDLSNNQMPELGSGMVGFVLQAGAAGTNVHDRLARGWVDVKDFGAVGDGLANDKAAFDAAAATGRTILLPTGNYNVPSGSYTNSRFYSFDAATTNNGTIVIVDPLANSLAVGTQVSFACAPASLPFGWLHRNGQTLNRAVYPQLWSFADGSGNIVDEANKPTNKSAFGRGNGTSTFSLPDDRGTNWGSADADAGVDSTFVLGKQVAVTAATATPGITVRSSISTPAIRAFASAANQGTIDIQALQAQVSATNARFGTQALTAWVVFRGQPLTGTYTQTGTSVTVTMTAHGMSPGQIVNLTFTTGTAISGSFTVGSVPTANTFTYVAAAPVTTSGNVTRNIYIKSSYNVNSITDLGVGYYQINFTASMASSNYAATLGYSSDLPGVDSFQQGSTTRIAYVPEPQKSTTNFRIYTGVTGNGTTDFAEVSVMVSGGLS